MISNPLAASGILINTLSVMLGQPNASSAHGPSAYTSAGSQMNTNTTVKSCIL